MEDWCYICGNNGFLDKVCPKCGREPKKVTIRLEEREDVDSFLEEVALLGVPIKYRGVFWDKGVMEVAHKKLLGDKIDKSNTKIDYNFVKFLDQLDKVNSVFSNKLLSSKSAIIIAPPGFSKKVFAFSCMQRALDAGFTVAPLLDTVELKRLLVLSAEKPYYKLYNQIDYDTYITSDVCFITVTMLKQRENAYEVIQEIIDKRSRKGLGTFIISRYTLEEISKQDYSNEFSAIKNTSNDDFKYPAIIMYKGGINK